jgi:hypothetical protein
MPPEIIDTLGAIAVMATVGSFVTLWVWMIRSTRRKAFADPTEAFQAMEQRLEQRLARLEVAVDDMSAALGRVTDGQQFLTKVLAQRSESPRDA